MSAKNSKTFTNSDISELLSNIAAAYQIKHKDFFRTVSYQNAADTIATYPQSIYDIWKKNPQALDQIPNIGPNIYKKLDYWFKNYDYPESVKKAFSGIHPAVFTIIKVNGIGPKTADKLTGNLNFPKNSIKALEKLIAYAKNGVIANIPTLGLKSQNQILENTLNFLGRHQKMTYQQAKRTADPIIAYLHLGFPDLEIYPLGSLRRQAAWVGDIDIAVKSSHSRKIIDYFINYPPNIQLINRGSKKASIKIKNDIRIDLMVQPAKNFGSLLQHFTGSKQHNINLRKHALNLGYSLSEYGIKDIKTGKIFTFDNEMALYKFLGFKFIPPEARLGENELETYQR